MHSNHLFKRMTSSSYFCAYLMVILITEITASTGGLPINDIDDAKTSVNDGGHLLLVSSNPSDDIAESKRAWQNLQGSWGKRNSNDLDLNADNNDNYVSDNNLEIGIANNYNNLNNNNLNNNINVGNNDYDYQDLVRYAMFYPRPELVIPAATASLNEAKRGWKNMNVAWGKRRSADWNKFRGAWGKREPGWNNLKGIWGKRGNDWNKLQSAWGKRSQQ